MIPDAKWLDALKLPARLKLAVGTACGVLLYLFRSGWVTLGKIDPLVTALLLIAVVVFGVLVVFDGVAYLAHPLTELRKTSALAARRAARRIEQEAERDQLRANVLAQLDHLSRWEVKVLAKALEADSPTFYDYVYSPPVGMLQAKHIVWTTGGTHHQDHYPFTIADYVWAELLRRREEFLGREQAFQAEEEENRRARRPNRWD